MDFGGAACECGEVESWNMGMVTDWLPQFGVGSATCATLLPNGSTAIG
jgi:hypothetical protein